MTCQPKMNQAGPGSWVHIFHKSLALGSRPAPQTTLKADVSVERHVSHYRREEELGGLCLCSCASKAHPTLRPVGFYVRYCWAKKYRNYCRRRQALQYYLSTRYPHPMHVSSYFTVANEITVKSFIFYIVIFVNFHVSTF